MEPLKHECGIAQVRLLKPLEYYQEHYGTWRLGINKLYLLMEKQHNRGQDGAGIVCVKTDSQLGSEYIFRERALGSGAISELFDRAGRQIAQSETEGEDFILRPFAGNMYMGHLRYSTTGRHGIQYLHPLVRRDNYRARSLTLCGNFNLTNAHEVFDLIAAKGQYPRSTSDTYILLEQLGHRLDREVEKLYVKGKEENFSGLELTNYIEDRIDMAHILRECSPTWDGGYVICCMTGSGEQFAMRDPWGIRPAFYYYDDDVLIVASERPVIQTAMNVLVEDVHELQPGQAIMVNKYNQVRIEQILEPKPNVSKCSFERIYFSRGSDKDIYEERKHLGYNLVPAVVKACDNDLLHSVISFIPNTAEVAYYGMLHGFDDRLNAEKAKAIAALEKEGCLTEEAITKILSSRVRSEKVAIKDIKLRTFITENSSRNDMAAHVYDVTYGIIEDGVDNLVVIDDSIVRGTTLKNSIIKILSRLRPRKLVIVSSSPQVRYPDFYGIDMSHMQEFIAFRAAVALLKERGMESVMREVYDLCKHDLENGILGDNHVKKIYAPFTDDEISQMICRLVTEPDNPVPVECIFQSIDGLHEACPDHTGDWYFSGNYPTPGGLRQLFRTYVQYYESTYLQ